MLDATVVIPWFERVPAPHATEAREIRREFEAGRVAVTVPSLLFLEVLNVAGRQWRWGELALVDLASRLESAGFLVVEPQLAAVAEWVARGLTAYDATYVALAEARSVKLVTADRRVLEIAADLSRPPSAFSEP